MISNEKNTDLEDNNLELNEAKDFFTSRLQDLESEKENWNTAREKLEDDVSDIMKFQKQFETLEINLAEKEEEYF
jgi:hypothetical protein